jgi:transcriptional regulator with XRE-family HTH domain
MLKEIEPKDLAYHLFDILESVRIERGHSRQQLAEHSGVNKSSLWFNANHTNKPGLDRIIAIAISLGYRLILNGSRKRSWDITKSPTILAFQFVTYLDNLRKEKHRSIAQFERLAGLPLGGWYKCQIGQTDISIEKLTKVARSLGCELELVSNQKEDAV